MNQLNYPLIAPFPYQCPFCNSKTTINDSDFNKNKHWVINFDGTEERILYSYFITCPDSNCKKTSVIASFHNLERAKTEAVHSLAPINIFRLIPSHNSLIFPDYIPIAIREDYYEACKILELSPKASATLLRRCLQGMIRDFWNVKGKSLKDELDKLVDLIDPITWKAIDSVRKIGNIGAHMEKDVNLIIDVKIDEASTLIALIEYLLNDWYITKHEREENLKRIIEIGDSKK